ncbi:MAG: hypothetical protein HC906_19265 [Bacteroidales bacterium]|nr:hypothetical protein [Bacteroidales bacterium]
MSSEMVKLTGAKMGLSVNCDRYWLRNNRERFPGNITATFGYFHGNSNRYN